MESEPFRPGESNNLSKISSWFLVRFLSRFGSKNWPQTLRWVYNRLFPTMLVGLALVIIWLAGQHAEPFAHDLFLRWSAKPATGSPVTLVLIDDESLGKLHARFGPLPWPRKAYLEIFQRVHAGNPTVMVFDSHFIGIAEKGDEQFFNALKGFPELISGLVMEEQSGISTSMSMNTNLPQYYNLNLGVVSVSEDEDGIIRSAWPFFSEPAGFRNGGVFPAISLAAAYEFLKHGYSIPSDPRQALPRGQSHTVPVAQRWTVDWDNDNSSRLRLYPENQPEREIDIFLSRQGTFGLRWERILNPGQPEYARSHLAIPLWKFFGPNAAGIDLTGKIALIGASSSVYRDYHKTPMANRHLGPDIHATAIDNLLSGHTIEKVSPWNNLGMLLLLCVAVFMLRFRYQSISRTLLYTLGTMIIYSWMVFWCLSTRGWWLDEVTPVLFMTAAFVAGSTCRISQKEKHLAVMEKNLSQLVDPEVFQEIRRLSHVLVPGGQKLEITSMFVDIRNFTALAEHLQPHDLTEILNEFYGETVKIIFGYHGTIDKFMGDGILIIFGAPLPQADHRLLALRAAIDLLEVTAKLCARWRQMLNIDTEIGITLNSGPAFVGFFGPADKLEYTGVGDTVNICVRLQEHTRQFGTRLLISESTLSGLADALSEQLPAVSRLPLGEVIVRGREGSIRIFTVRQALL